MLMIAVGTGVTISVFSTPPPPHMYLHSPPLLYRAHKGTRDKQVMMVPQVVLVPLVLVGRLALTAGLDASEAREI